MISKKFDRHLKYYTTITRGLASGLILLSLYYLVFRPGIGYLIAIYIGIFMFWWLLTMFFVGKVMDLMPKMGNESKKEALYDIFTSVGDIGLNTLTYGIVMILLFCIYNKLPATIGVFGVTSLIVLMIIAYLVVEYLTKKLLSKI